MQIDEKTTTASNDTPSPTTEDNPFTNFNRSKKSHIISEHSNGDVGPFKRGSKRYSSSTDDSDKINPINNKKLGWKSACQNTKHRIKKINNCEMNIGEIAIQPVIMLLETSNGLIQSLHYKLSPEKKKLHQEKYNIDK